MIEMELNQLMLSLFQLLNFNPRERLGSGMNGTDIEAHLSFQELIGTLKCNLNVVESIKLK